MILGCPVCRSEDTNHRIYGELPQFAIIGCFDCARMYIKEMKPLRTRSDEELERVKNEIMETFDKFDINL